MNVFPTLVGLGWDRTKIAVWSTQVRTAVSGKRKTASLWKYPLWRFKLQYGYLPDSQANVNSDFRKILGFFNIQKGAYAPFLYDDTTDNSVTVPQQLGICSGADKSFQLIRNMGGWVEPIKYPKAETVKVYKNGVLQVTGYTVTDGLITFTAAPVAGTVITATFEFYFCVQFAEDQMEFNNFLYNLYELKTLELVSVK